MKTRYLCEPSVITESYVGMYLIKVFHYCNKGKFLNLRSSHSTRKQLSDIVTHLIACEYNI